MKKILLAVMACSLLLSMLLGCIRDEGDAKGGVPAASAEASKEDLHPSRTVMPELLPEEKGEDEPSASTEAKPDKEHVKSYASPKPEE